MNTRADIIEAHFVDHMERVGGVAVPLDPWRWAAVTLAGSSPIHRPFGWLPPCREVPGGFVLRFCPSIIETQTADLDDDRLLEYIDAISFSADLHITNWERTPEDRERTIDRVLYDIAPGTLRLLTEVQTKAMDAGVRG